jgi:hypothetical protein
MPVVAHVFFRTADKFVQQIPAMDGVRTSVPAPAELDDAKTCDQPNAVTKQGLIHRVGR